MTRCPAPLPAYRPQAIAAVCAALRAYGAPEEEVHAARLAAALPPPHAVDNKRALMHAHGAAAQTPPPAPLPPATAPPDALRALAPTSMEGAAAAHDANYADADAEAEAEAEAPFSSPPERRAHPSCCRRPHP